MSTTSHTIIDSDLQTWTVTAGETPAGFDEADLIVSGEGLRGGTVCLNTVRWDDIIEVSPATARRMATALLCAADHAEAVGRP